MASGFAFGYAHYLIFAAVGAVSAGIEVELDLLSGEGEQTSGSAASLAFAIPVGVYLVAAWAVLLRGKVSRPTSIIVLACAAAVLACALLPVVTVAATAVLLVIAVVALEVDRDRSISR